MGTDPILILLNNPKQLLRMQEILLKIRCFERGLLSLKKVNFIFPFKPSLF